MPSLGGDTVDGQYGPRYGRGGTDILLRVILIVMLVGCVLTAWFLLRGYGRKDD
ncbi:hypothetical protein GCM10010340_18520 [Streptomyces griseoloalbus]|nr:hypothetical protein GCM10010294_04200 [Streptomyces griseoloalbus]GGW40853.1 hypothetical protein GCM10010340_18520 [Streptomyces albaduncus]